MRVRRTRTPLPRSFAAHPAAHALVAEADLRIGGRGSMRAKLLVFKTSAALTRFWREALGLRMSAGALGAVNALASDVEGQSGRYIECDPTYFCVIGLTLPALCMEVITHEAVHAGFAFAKRHRRDFWVEQDEGYDEEDVCYPAGRIAKRINAFLHEKGLYR